MAKFNLLEPLKNLEGVASFIHGTRDWILALQQKEFNKETLRYLACRQLTEKPYISDYSHEPDQIIQIKNLSNALYLVEQIFEKLPKIHLSSRRSILGIGDIKDQADEARRLLLNVGVEFEGAFKDEIRNMLSFLSIFKAFTGCSLIKVTLDPKTLTTEKIRSLLKNQVGCIQHLEKIYYFNNKTLKEIPKENISALKSIMSSLHYDVCRMATGSDIEVITNATGQSPFMSNFFENADPIGAINAAIRKAGLMSGHAIDQLKPATGKLDYTLLSWVSGVLPAYIETIRVGIEQSAATESFSLPKVDKEKMAFVLQKKLDKISNSIKETISTVSSIKDPASLIANLPALFTLPSHVQQMQPLLTEILQEVDHLQDTTQNRVHEYLAELKYEVLPNLFALIDKFEIQLLLEPGRLSEPLMDEIKPLHERLIQATSNYLNVKFTDKAEQLLKLEDAQFLGLRLAPRHQQIDASKKVLHQVELTLQVLDSYLKIIDTNQEHLILPSKAALKAHLILIEPYLTHLDDQLKQLVSEHLSTQPVLPHTAATWLKSWFPSSNNNPALPALNTLKVLLVQIKNDQIFRIQHNQAIIDSVNAKANMVLFEHNKAHNIYDVSEKSAFDHRYSLSDTIQFDDQGIITNPDELSADETWDLYQWYDNKLTAMKAADADGDWLLKALRNDQSVNKTSTIAFHPDYIPCLLEKKSVQHQPNRLYVNIDNGSLKYEVMEPLAASACSLLKMSQFDPQTLDTPQISSLLGNHDGFIQYKDKVFYFDRIKLISVPLEKIPRLKPKMDALPDDELRIVDTHEPEFELIASEDIRAVCKLYLMHLDEAKEAGHRNCYVWNREIKQLSYIDVNGQVQDKLTLSAKNKSLLTLFVEKKNIHIFKKIEGKRLEKKGPQAVLSDKRVDKTDDEDSNCYNLTAGNLASFINPIICGLVWMPAESIENNLKKLSAAHYIRTEFGLSYYNKEKGVIQAIELDSPQLKDFNREFTAGKNIEELSPEQLKVITSMTGHAPSCGSHHPGVIRTGTILLSELNCSLTTLTSITPLKPFLPRVFDKALERGHIHNQQKSQCIKWYSSIQPYLVDASFDKDVVNFFSGNVYKDATKPLPIFSVADFKPQLLGLKNQLSVKQLMLREKRDHYFEEIKDKIFSVETRPINAIYHHQFSPDVAEFMLSIEPVKRQVHESGKTLFKVKLALEHLEKYCRKTGLDNTSFDRDNKHYPWLHTWVTQLTTEQLTPTVVTPERLKTHLKKIQFYEEADINRNTLIIESFNKRAPQELKPCDFSEASAFKYFATKLKPCLMKEGNELEPNQLHIKITGKQLHYKFLHYGKPQVGKILLDRLKPLNHFNEKTILDKTVLSNILSIIYAQRTSEIESDRALLSPDEALELYQWYLSRQADMAGLSSDEQISLQNKVALYEKYASRPPESDPRALASGFPLPNGRGSVVLGETKPVEHESRESHLIKHARFGAELTDIKQSIATHFDNLTDSFKQELIPASSGVPFPDAGYHNPFTEYVQQIYPLLESRPLNFKWSGEELVINSLHAVAIPEWFANKIPGELKQIGSTVVHQALMGGINHYLSVKSYLKSELELIIPQSPHQVLAYKRLMNIAYYLEQIMHEIEKINEGESKLSRVSHLLVSYLYSADIYPLVIALSADPHFAPFFQDIVSRVKSAVKCITDEGEQYSALEQITLNATPVKNAHLLYFMNVLNMLPERISLGDEAYKEKRRALKASAAKTTANIEKIMNDYQASYWSLFFDLPIILGLLNKLPKSIIHFATQANIKIKGDLEKTPPEILSEIMIEAGSWEMTIGLKPGTISIPIKKIVDEFYQGLITPLILDADRQVSLLCDPEPMKKRILSTEDQISSANIELESHERAWNAIQDILDAGNDSLPSLNQMYKEALPIFKKALNGANLYVTSFNDAKTAKLTDCFIWNDQQSQLFYIDSKGRPNPQTGCDLYLKSIPVGQTITEEVLNQPVKMYMPGKEKVELPITTVKKPTLIKQGDNYFIYENSSDGAWKCNELDSDIIARMHLDFDKTKRLRKNKAYADMYAEITKKTGWTYPIHLKNTHSLIACIRDKKRDQTSASTPLYLSEKEIKKLVTSNSHFFLPKHGVSLPEEAGCCLISMLTVPEKFDDLKLPPDYSAYYVQVSGVHDALYYIDRKTRLIKKLDIIPDEALLINSAISNAKKNNPAFDERQLPQDRNRYYLLNNKLYIDREGLDENSKGVEEFAAIPDKAVIFDDIISKIKKNRPMLNADFHAIESLTTHVYEPGFISNLDDFELNTQNIAQLQSLALNCKDHYEGLYATSRLTIKAAQEQLDFLKNTELEQPALNKGIKKSVYTDYFNKKIDDLCKTTEDLQGYTLCMLSESTKIEPDRIYVNIKDNKIDYKVIDPTGLEQKGSIQLSEIDPSLKHLASVDELQPYLPKILKITAKQGARHSRSHSLAFEYQTKLRAALLTGRDSIIEEAMAMDSDSKSIDKALKHINDGFNKENLEQYCKLNAVNQALDDFKLYLNRAEKQWTTRRSLFENDKTIREKRSTLNYLDTLAANDNEKVSVRIEKIQNYLLKDETLDQLLDYANYESNQFARLFQLVSLLFEKLGLYTPKVVQHVDNLLRPLTEEPTADLPKQTSQYRFFAETTRERIQNQANELKEKNKNEPDSPKGVPKAPS